ncbi:MAG: hypothetical protein KGJ90_05085 [Patescibacteria group bacterium]|nr:hypothetical protein [Patescibacteria group bacterium]
MTILTGNETLNVTGITNNGNPSGETFQITTSDIATLAGNSVNVMNFGAINDGGAHPLSNYYPTLAAAQAVYPTATSLSNEIDSVAIENAMAYAVANNFNTVYFPTSTTVGGYYRINKFIPVPYTLGAREGCMTLLGDSATADQESYVEVFKRTVSAAGFQIYGTSLSVNSSNHQIKKVIIQGLTFDGGWAVFNTNADYPMIDCNAGYEFVFNDVVVTETLGHGILLREVEDSRFNNVRVTWCGQHNGYQKALTMTNTSTNATVSDTTGLYVGQRIYGTGLQTVRIASITNATTIVLSAAANFTGTRTVGFEAKASVHICSNDTGNATSNNLYIDGLRIENGAGCGLRIQGSNIVDIFMSKSKIENNDYATDYLLDVDTATAVNVNNTWLYGSPRRLNYMEWAVTTAGKTLSSLSSAALDSFTLNTYHTDTGTITNGSTHITGLADTSSLTVGQRIVGTGLPDDGIANVCVASIVSGTEITMTSTGTAATAGSKALTFQYFNDSGNFNRRYFYTGLPIIAYDTTDTRNYYIARTTNYDTTTGTLSLHVLNVFGDTSKSITSWKVAVAHIGMAYFGQSAITCKGHFEGGYPDGTPVTSYPYLSSYVHLDGINGYDGDAYMNSGAVMLPKNSFQAQTSTTSVTIGTGAQTFTIATGLNATMFVAGAAVYVSQNAIGSEQNWMIGTITSYTSGTGALVTNITSTSGSGTIANWKITFAPQPLHLQTGTNTNIVTKEMSPSFSTPAASSMALLPIMSDVRANNGSTRVKSVVATTSGQYGTITADSSTLYLVTDTASIYFGSTLIGTNLASVNAWTGQQYFAQATLTDGATINWNLNTQQAAKVTLGGNRTLANPTNMQAGGTYTLIIVQDGTGSRTLAYGANYKWPAGTAPVLSTTAGAIDIITFVSDGTNMYGAIQKGFA